MDVWGRNTSKEYIEAVTEGFIKDALRPDTRILSIYDFSFEFREDRAYVWHNSLKGNKVLCPCRRKPRNAIFPGSRVQRLPGGRYHAHHFHNEVKVGG